jgi:hypothetical protein
MMGLTWSVLPRSHGVLSARIASLTTRFVNRIALRIVVASGWSPVGKRAALQVIRTPHESSLDQMLRGTVLRVHSNRVLEIALDNALEIEGEILRTAYCLMCFEHATVTMLRLVSEIICLSRCSERPLTRSEHEFIAVARLTLYDTAAIRHGTRIGAGVT